MTNSDFGNPTGGRIEYMPTGSVLCDAFRPADPSKASPLRLLIAEPDAAIVGRDPKIT